MQTVLVATHIKSSAVAHVCCGCMLQVIVQARKPEFFNNKMSLYETVTEDGLMRPAMDAKKNGSLYCGGGAAMVERALDMNGDEILYVGDHIYTDSALAKINFRCQQLAVLAIIGILA